MYQLLLEGGALVFSWQTPRPSQAAAGLHALGFMERLKAMGLVRIIFKLTLQPGNLLPHLSLMWPFSSAIDGDSEGRGRGSPILVAEDG